MKTLNDAQAGEIFQFRGGAQNWRCIENTKRQIVVQTVGDHGLLGEDLTYRKDKPPMPVILGKRIIIMRAAIRPGSLVCPKEPTGQTLGTGVVATVWEGGRRDGPWDGKLMCGVRWETTDLHREDVGRWPTDYLRCVGHMSDRLQEGDTVKFLMYPLGTKIKTGDTARYISSERPTGGGAVVEHMGRRYIVDWYLIRKLL